MALMITDNEEVNMLLSSIIEGVKTIFEHEDLRPEDITEIVKGLEICDEWVWSTKDNMGEGRIE